MLIYIQATWRVFFLIPYGAAKSHLFLPKQVLKQFLCLKFKLRTVEDFVNNL